MEKTLFLNKEGRDHRLEILRALARSIASEIDGLLGTTTATPADAHDQVHINLEEEVRRFESDLIRFALFKVGGHQSKAAKLLGVKPSTLHEKIKRHRIPVVVYTPVETYSRIASGAE